MSGSSSEAAFVAVSTNPAIDRVARIDEPCRGVAHAVDYLETPGGKAAHAASVAAELGASARLLTTAGGSTGRRLLELLEGAPFAVEAVEVAGETRGTYTVVGPAGDDLEVHEPSSPLGPSECDDLVAALSTQRNAPAVAAIAGSLPPGTPDDLHARLVAAGRALGAFTILDCSTPPALEAALAARPDLVAPNLAEARALLGGTGGGQPSEEELAALSAELRNRGAGAVWLSLGSWGSILGDAGGITSFDAPAPERIVNAVGCGDALVGGLAAGLARGRDLVTAAALGVAAAADKITHLDPGTVDRSAVEAIAKRMQADRPTGEVALS